MNKISLNLEFETFEELIQFLNERPVSRVKEASIKLVSPEAEKPTAPTKIITSAPRQVAKPIIDEPTQVAQPSTPTAPAPARPKATVPTSTTVFTIDDVVAESRKVLITAEARSKVIELLKSFGVSSLDDLKAEDYASFIASLREVA